MRHGTATCLRKDAFEWLWPFTVAGCLLPLWALRALPMVPPFGAEPLVRYVWHISFKPLDPERRAATFGVSWLVVLCLNKHMIYLKKSKYIFVKSTRWSGHVSKGGKFAQMEKCTNFSKTLFSKKQRNIGRERWELSGPNSSQPKLKSAQTQVSPNSSQPKLKSAQTQASPNSRQVLMAPPHGGPPGKRRQVKNKKSVLIASCFILHAYRTAPWYRTRGARTLQTMYNYVQKLYKINGACTTCPLKVI